MLLKLNSCGLGDSLNRNSRNYRLDSIEDNHLVVQGVIHAFENIRFRKRSSLAEIVKSTTRIFRYIQAVGVGQ